MWVGVGRGGGGGGCTLLTEVIVSSELQRNLRLFWQGNCTSTENSIEWKGLKICYTSVCVQDKSIFFLHSVSAEDGHEIPPPKKKKNDMKDLILSF